VTLSYQCPETANAVGYSRIVDETHLGHFVLACGGIKHKLEGVKQLLSGGKEVMVDGGSKIGECDFRDFWSDIKGPKYVTYEISEVVMSTIVRSLNKCLW